MVAKYVPLARLCSTIATATGLTRKRMVHQANADYSRPNYFEHLSDIDVHFCSDGE
jgi:hypothetical protein